MIFKIIFNQKLSLILIIFLSSFFCSKSNEDGFCYRKEDCENDLHLFATNELNGMKYILYDVSREKSYSLRRRIYINMARTVQRLGLNWTLVLPPWGLYVPNWEINNDLSKNRITWSDFFKIEILQELIPVIEFNEFLEHISNELDLVLILNKFKNYSFDEDELANLVQSNRYELIDENCKHIQFYKNQDDQHIYGLFYGYKDYIKAKEMTCMNVEYGNSRIIEDVLQKELKHIHSLFIQNVDLIKHSEQEDRTYWLFRRSLQFNDRILTRANKFRRKYFDSDDEKDKTFIGSDWQLEKLNRQKQSDIAVGGEYIAVHWFINSNGQIDDRITDDPNDEIEQLKVDQIIQQILIALKKTNTTLVFVATDGDDNSWSKLNEEFKEQLKLNFKSLDKYKLFRYKNKSKKLPPLEFESICAWICAHARLFIGTPNSMFTQLIQEEREILRFDSLTTFNVFCTKKSDSLCTDNKQNRIKF